MQVLEVFKIVWDWFDRTHVCVSLCVYISVYGGHGDEQSPEKSRDSGEKKGFMWAKLMDSSSKERVNIYEHLKHVYYTENKIKSGKYTMETCIYTYEQGI